MKENERSTKEIREDIVNEEMYISRTVEQIGEHLKTKVDWRTYVNESPYWALGAAAGLGYIASKKLKRRITPMERALGSFSEAVGHSLGRQLAGAAGPGLIKLSVLGIVTKVAANMAKNAVANRSKK
jgi:hypothetical protein